MRNKIFWSLLILVASINTFQWAGQAIVRLQNPSAVPFHTLGFKFMGLEKVLDNVRYAGYYTDKNMELPLTIAQFEQAQYILSPTVLDLNNTDRLLIIFDCTSPDVSLKKIKELGLKPMIANKDGIMLAYNPKAARP